MVTSGKDYRIRCIVARLDARLALIQSYEDSINNKMCPLCECEFSKLITRTAEPTDAGTKQIYMFGHTTGIKQKQKPK